MCVLQFGPVLDVVAKKAGGMKEQGFVVFRDVMTAATAMRSLQVHFITCESVSPGGAALSSARLCRHNAFLSQGFKFLGKPMKITYARGTSDIVARANGMKALITLRIAHGQKELFFCVSAAL